MQRKLISISNQCKTENISSQVVKYQLTALVMGYSCSSPKLWTTLIKPVFAYQRLLGHVSAYIHDDSWLFGKTFSPCLENVIDRVHLMDSLGLTINQTRSVLLPCLKIVFIVFILHSMLMTIRLTPQKCQDINICSQLLKLWKHTTVQVFAKLCGKLNAAEIWVLHAYNMGIMIALWMFHKA